MGIKLRGVQNVARNMNRIINDIQGRKIVRALQSALLIGGLRAAHYTPIDSSTLINSQFREIINKGVIITGRIGYSANYAAYVHDAPGKHLGKKTPRPVKKGEAPGSRGNIWDNTGKPKFLTLGFEEERSAIDDVVRKELSL